jgi:hypothetical protein
MEQKMVVMDIQIEVEIVGLYTVITESLGWKMIIYSIQKAM